MKKELRYCRPKRTSDHTRVKMATKGKLIDRLGNKNSMNLQKSTTSNGNKGRRNITSRTLVIGLYNPPKERNTIENRPNIQNVRCRVVSSKGIYQQKLKKTVYKTILFQV